MLLVVFCLGEKKNDVIYKIQLIFVILNHTEPVGSDGSVSWTLLCWKVLSEAELSKWRCQLLDKEQMFSVLFLFVLFICSVELGRSR